MLMTPLKSMRNQSRSLGLYRKIGVLHICYTTSLICRFSSRLFLFEQICLDFYGFNLTCLIGQSLVPSLADVDSTMIHMGDVIDVISVDPPFSLYNKRVGSILL